MYSRMLPMQICIISLIPTSHDWRVAVVVSGDHLFVVVYIYHGLSSTQNRTMTRFSDGIPLLEMRRVLLIPFILIQA